MKEESACKPGSVEDGHSSRPAVADGLKQPTRFPHGPRVWNPIWSCSEWGLPCRSVARLAVRSYRTVSPLPRLLAAPCRFWQRGAATFGQPAPSTAEPFGGLLSVALSVGLRRPGVTWHSALWSPDFPPLPLSQAKAQQRPSSQLRARRLRSASL